MHFLFILSQENLPLSRFELETVLGQRVSMHGHIALGKPGKDFSRLALTKQANQLLFSCNPADLEDRMKSFDWNKWYKKDFYLSTRHLPKRFTKKFLADIIYDTLKYPQVNVSNPKTVFELIFLSDRVYATKREWVNTDDFEKRKAHKKPEHHPTALHPKLAKTLVNITGIKKGKIVDPFCGAGGLLLEAGLMGFKPVGYDNDEVMLKKADINLRNFGLKDFKLKLKDARELEKCRYITTDPPYGLASKGRDVRELYTDFLNALAKVQKRAVVVFPDFFNYKNKVRKAGLKIVREFKWYVHKGMTRNIVVIETHSKSS